MVTFVRRVLSYWVLLILAALGAYVMLYNREPIYVMLPGVGEFKVLSAIAFMVCFLLGASFVCVYFIIDVTRKTWEIRSLRKKNALLNEQLQRDQGKSPLRHAASTTPSVSSAGKAISPKNQKDTFPPEGEFF